VPAGTEGHSRVQAQNNIIGSGLGLLPGRHDQKPPADAERFEIGLPTRAPILAVHRRNGRLRNGQTRIDGSQII
jgi:hypothetical protein